jgi:CBS domain-containing protein
MKAKNMIADGVLPVSSTDRGSEALISMDENKISHIPVVDDGEYIGIISEVDVYNMSDLDSSIGESFSVLPKPSVFEHEHFFDVIKVMSLARISAVPVVDRNDKYVGTITLNRLMKNLAEFTVIKQPGAIIVLELNHTDYVLSQIAQIVESHDSKILSLFIAAKNESTKIEVTLKVNRTDIEPVIQTFNRYDYVIKETYTEDQDSMEDLKDRYDSLMNYLNI